MSLALPRGPKLPEPGIVPSAPAAGSPNLGLGGTREPARGGAGLGLGALLPEVPPEPKRTAGSILRDISADIGGRPAPSDVAKQQRSAAMRERLGQFGQLLGLAEILRQGLDRVPIGEQAEKRAALRDELEAGMPGFGEVFDTFVGDAPELSEDLIQSISASDAGKTLLLTGGVREVLDFAKSETFQAEARQKKDQRLFPEISAKVSRLLTTTDPELRKQLQQAQKGGLSVADIQALNDSLPEGEEGFKLTPQELESLPRLQGGLAQRFPDRFVTEEGFEAEKKLQRQKELAAVQQSGVARESLELRKQELAEALKTPFGTARTRDDAKKIKEAAEAKEAFERMLEEMIALRDDAGFLGGEVLNRSAVARGKQLSKSALLELKNLAKLGVLSASDENIINEIIPADPLEFDFSAGDDRVKEKLQGALSDVRARFGATLKQRLSEPAAAAPPATPGAGGNGSKVFVVPGKGRITVSPGELEEFLQEFPNAQEAT